MWLLISFKIKVSTTSVRKLTVPPGLRSLLSPERGGENTSLWERLFPVLYTVHCILLSLPIVNITPPTRNVLSVSFGPGLSPKSWTWDLLHFWNFCLKSLFMIGYDLLLFCGFLWEEAGPVISGIYPNPVVGLVQPFWKENLWICHRQNWKVFSGHSLSTTHSFQSLWGVHLFFTKWANYKLPITPVEIYWN